MYNSVPTSSPHDRFACSDRSAESQPATLTAVQDLDDAPAAFTWKSVGYEQQILDVLDRQPEAGERIEAAFQRKERDLATIFARSSVEDCRMLHKRLTISASDDPIAARFTRMIVARRTRLLAFLEGARRRAALARSVAR